MNFVLKVAGLRHAYGAVPALHVDVFHLAAGEHAVILGPSGCGKSTLLHVIAGILAPKSGQVEVAGTNVTALSSRASDAWRGRTIGFLPQRLALVPSLSIRENILLAAYAAGELPDRQRAEALLYALGLGDKAASKPGQLSLGQQQRAAIARALYHRPQLLLADEPTANLDDAACRAAVSLLAGLAAEAGASLVMATHDARVLAALPRAKVLRLDMPMREAA